MAKVILAIGHDLLEDPHVAVIEKHMKALDSKARLVRLDPMCDSNFIEINTRGNTSENTIPSCFVIVNGERIPAESITTVWFLWHLVGSKGDSLREYIAKDYVSSEWGTVVRSLESYLSHARWVNPLDAMDLAYHKPNQLLLAQQVGLTVPKTVITNNPTAVEKLFDEAANGRVIFKTLNRLYIPPETVVFTTEITRQFLSESASGIAHAPAIFQELVERKSDLRITVVGRQLFVVRIASQMLDDEKGRLDWRRCQYGDKHIYSEAQLPESFKERLMEFHERTGLCFAAYDCLETDDDIIFLECNPRRAAWLWLEDALHLKVSEALARYLLGTDD